ncbi:phenylalanine--tRNA ligase subunit alpha [Geovibrio thiophilus]|uniref:Phenylalanine--tRNA ligase alpha subunit n=1 Tax=Geovibrio thiophilus TaxID=139438 RepID=A0A410K0J4_9BACT|nr:phenylalanine--tRNA ligase subunit alpha [Geovibrio thiophilus]QAR33845.1 phenylalanine--tRNA ligase subunit alpha [Geovibrio thiophilus]
MQLDISGLEGYRTEIAQAGSLDALYQVKVKYLGKNGLISNLNRQLKDISSHEDKKEAGMKIGSLRADFEALHDAKELELKGAEKNAKLTGESLDITLPGLPFTAGSIHPVTKVFDEIVDIFSAMGFEVAIGPEVEHDFYNFEALNIPKEHPARDMQDTFYITDEILMRTHTSPVQVRTMLKNKPPVKIIAPGKVYRCDSDITHTPMFHQVEGLLVDERTTFGDLKGILTVFIQKMFGDNVPVRFRPSFFPFTEPSAEVDMGCVICGSKGCRVCKQTGWLEILGCGMVDPAVFKHVDYDAEKYRGFAFGMGIERIAMLKYGIDDLRLFFENHLKFLKQF